MPHATPAPEFLVQAQPVPGMPHARKVHLAGRITYREAPRLRRAIFSEVENPDASILVLELGGVERLDTAGAAVLVEALLASRQRDVPMLLCEPSESVLQIFRLAGFPEILASCCSSVEEVRRKLAGAAAEPE